MQYARLLCAFLLLLGQGILIAPPAAAASSPMLLTHVMAGESGAATSEFVGLYNSSSEDIDITGYCLANKTGAKFACVSGGSDVRVFAKGHKYVTLVSAGYAQRHAAYQVDTVYPVTNQTSGSIVGSEDTIRLLDATGGEVDMLGWSSGLVAGSAWVRKESAPGQYVDTGQLADFVATPTPAFPQNDSYDVEVATDHCLNIADIQRTVPAGYGQDEAGDCYSDVCLNIEGLQREVPVYYTAEAGTCTERDLCENIPGTQHELPANYASDGTTCALDVPALQLSELLPNAAGSDTDTEFIELYNPTDRPADLGYYKLLVGQDQEKSYQLPAGTVLAPGKFIAIYNSNLKFSLINTTGKVSLATIEDKALGEGAVYENPEEGETWALIDGAWQYTNQVTPGEANRAMLVVGGLGGAGDDATSPPCPTGKYRHPLTNRCRNIETDAAAVTCDADQYRNPETGRCRKITTAAALAPCKDGQYRSEETNRCRNIEAASASLAACKEGQERNPETNRCRNVTSAMPAAGFAVEPTPQGPQAFIGWWALGIVLLGALGYGIWEWRQEIGTFVSRYVPWRGKS